MKQKVFKIGVPELQEAKFVIDVNGTKCTTWIDGKGNVQYNSPDFIKVNYYGDLRICRKTIISIEMLLRSVFDEVVFDDKRNARSGKRAKI
jgi:hypothetical protein